MAFNNYFILHDLHLKLIYYVFRQTVKDNINLLLKCQAELNILWKHKRKGKAFSPHHFPQPVNQQLDTSKSLYSDLWHDCNLLFTKCQPLFTQTSKLPKLSICQRVYVLTLTHGRELEVVAKKDKEADTSGQNEVPLQSGWRC